VVSEVARLVANRLGAKVEAELLKGLVEMDVEGPTPADFERMSELVRRHPDLGATKASIVALCERLHTDLVISLDPKRLGQVKPRHGALRFLPG
jgi:hypothetical protein